MKQIILIGKFNSLFSYLVMILMATLYATLLQRHIMFVITNPTSFETNVARRCHPLVNLQ